MPQLDLTFFFSSSITMAVGYLILLYIFELYIVPTMLENIKFRVKIVDYFNHSHKMKITNEEMKMKQLNEYITTEENKIKNMHN